MARTRQALNVAGRNATVSNLDKVMYPAAGFTKAQVIEYYVHAANFLLPHLEEPARHPQTLSGGHHRRAFL